MAIDITTGVFDSGKKWVSFSETGAAAGYDDIAVKDNTDTVQKVYLYLVKLQCGTGANIALYDGTEAGSPIMRLYGDPSVGSHGETWDFKDDPVILGVDSTSLCISAIGTYSGFVKYGWGV